MAQIEIENQDLIALDGITKNPVLQNLIDSIKADISLDEKIGTDKEAGIIKEIIKLWSEAGEGYLNPSYVTCQCCNKKSYLTLVQRGVCRGMIKGDKLDRIVLGVDLDPHSRETPPELGPHGITGSRMTLCTSCYKNIKDRLHDALITLNVQADYRNVFPDGVLEKDKVIRCHACGNEQYESEGNVCIKCGAIDKRHIKTDKWRLV